MIRQDGDSQSEVYALLLAPNLLERDNTFVVRAGKILVQLWVGSKSSPALLSRLPIGRHFDELPFDCFAVVVMSRWAAARCVISMANNHHKDLATKVSNTAVQVWRGTAAWPPIDSSAEIDLVRRLDGALGIAEAETDTLIEEYLRLRLSLMPVARAAE